jgi:hypothetical protein
MKTKEFSILQYNKFTFGEQIVSQFVLFEWKRLGSIIFFYFHKSNGAQDRFHTHAFNALSFKIFGQYDEHVLLSEDTGKYRVDKRTQFFKYFPRNSYHRIANSTGCLTILFSGRWHKNWREYINGTTVDYSWGRN